MCAACALSLGKPVLCVGSLSIDLLQFCRQVPQPNATEHCKKARWQRGGHAANVCRVLHLLGVQTELLAMLSRSSALQSMLRELHRSNIETSHCPRTELEPAYKTAEHFQQLDLSQYGWVHFEARSLRETLKMMRSIWEYNNGREERIRISLRVAADFAEHKDLFSMCDYVIVSHEMGVAQGWHSLDHACQELRRTIALPYSLHVRRPCFIISWGAVGAGCIDRAGNYALLPAERVNFVVDSYGVGHCFTAALIYAKYMRQMELKSALEFAIRISAAKLMAIGYKHLAKLYTYPPDPRSDADTELIEPSDEEDAELRICSAIFNRPIDYTRHDRKSRPMANIAGATGEKRFSRTVEIFSRQVRSIIKSYREKSRQLSTKFIAVVDLAAHANKKRT